MLSDIERQEAIHCAQRLERYARELVSHLRAHDDSMALLTLSRISEANTDVHSFGLDLKVSD